jgi:hypothetical protein
MRAAIWRPYFFVSANVVATSAALATWQSSLQSFSPHLW